MNKKTLCIIYNSEDRDWLVEYWQKQSSEEQIILYAPTLEAQLLAEELELPYESYQKYAWELDYPALFRIGRKMSRSWFELEGFRSNRDLQDVTYFKNYPLLVMGHSRLLFAIYEILQAHTLMDSIIKHERPEKIVYKNGKNPFENMISYIPVDDRGVERESAKLLAGKYGIKVLELSRDINEQVLYAGILSKLKRFIKKAYRNIKGKYQYARKKITVKNGKLFQAYQLQGQTGKKILIFSWGGYYLEQIAEVVTELHKQGLRIAICIVGGIVEKQTATSLADMGVTLFRRTEWAQENEKALFEAWQVKGDSAFSSLNGSDELTRHFSINSESIFPGLAELAVKDLLTKALPRFVTELSRSEQIISFFEPDLVLTPFAVHGLEVCDVLPARSLGIPTLTIQHGVNGNINAVRDAVATNYYAVLGPSYKKALIALLKYEDGKVFAIGDSRMENISKNAEVNEVKHRLGFDVSQPLCIYCDSSGWVHGPVFRHATSKVVREVISLKHSIPNLQLVFRVHHGAFSNAVKNYIEALAIPGLYFQMSPNPLFTEIVHAADVVIAHHNSAITEALISGVRVIYLCELSEVEPMYIGHEMIKVARNFEDIKHLVEEILQKPMSKQEVRLSAQPYFDEILCGNDGMATQRLVDMILDLAQKPEYKGVKDFDDWLQRIDASCEIGAMDMVNENLMAS